MLRYTNAWALEQGFIDWLEEANVFCNTLVDRIVPGFPKEMHTGLKRRPAITIP
ncbi:hypothetical protein PO124_07970 [Bacillus licheniformis]|nr:hypothetical protein [Bacillus licheniformis]